MIETIIIAGSLLAAWSAYHASRAITKYEARNSRRNRFKYRKVT